MKHPIATQARRREIVTATGWRIHGSAVDLVSTAAAAGLAAPEVEQDIVFSAVFDVRPRLGTDAVAPVLASLTRAVNAARPDGRSLTREGAISEIAGRFHGIHWDTFRDVDRWTGELLWRHVHPAITGIACTTHVVISEHPGRVRLTIRVGTPGGSAAVRGPVGMGQARPAFLSDLHRSVRLIAEGSTSDATTLVADDIPGFVRDTLLADNRIMPIAVVAPTEGGEYLVPLTDLADELAGLAHLFAIDKHPTTYGLTNELGDKRLSCYWGALRVYMPDFSCADASEMHPLLVGDRVVDPVMRAGLVGQLAILARRRVPFPVTVSAMRNARAKPAPSVVKLVATSEPIARTVVAPPIAEPVQGLQAGSDGIIAARIDGVNTALARLLQLSESLVDELAGLRMTTNVRAGNAGALERRIGQLERLLRDHVGTVPRKDEMPVTDTREAPPEADDSEYRVTLVSVVQQAATVHGDALLILDSALASATDSPFEEVDRVAVILEAMALIARRRQAGTLGMSLRDAFREMAIEYRGGIAATTSAKQRRQYDALLSNGTRVSCDEHIVLGTSYDPRYCLRVYFTSRASGEARFVIAHIGRHFEVKTTT